MTRISEMTPVQVTSPTGMYAPVEKTGSTTNYRLDIAATMTVTPQMFGALADGVTNDIAAVQATLDYMASTGGEIYVPTGSYLQATALTLDSKHNFALVGPSGGGAGGGSPPPAQIIFSGTGTTGGISAAHGEAILLTGLRVTYNAAFTGDLIAFTNLTAASDAAYCGLDRVLAGGSGSHNGARCVVSFEGAIISAVTNSHLQKAQVGIRFCKQVGVGNVLYSNANLSFNNTFDNLTTAALTDFGQGCLSLADRAEGTNDGTSGGMKAYYLDTLDVGASPGNGNAFLSPWCGDDVALTTAWWCNGNRQHQGLLFAGGFYGTANTMKPCLKFSATIQGAAVIGTYMAPVSIDLASADHYALFIAGNYFGADVTNLTASSDDVFIVANKLNGAFAKNYVRLNTVQEWNIGANNRPTAGPGIWSFSAPAATDAFMNINADSGKSLGYMGRVAGSRRFFLGSLDGTTVDLALYSNADGFVGSGVSFNRTTMAATFGGTVAATNLSGTNTGDETSGSVVSKLAGQAIAPLSTAIGSGTVITKIVAYTPSITPASVAAATVAEQTFTVTGLTTADKVIVNPPAIANATGIAGARVSAADTLAIRFVNPTAGALTPTSGTYTVLAVRS